MGNRCKLNWKWVSGNNSIGMKHGRSETLDQYLSSDDSPPNSLCLSDLDGFLTGILCSPELIMPSEWLPGVWGESEPKTVNAHKHIWATQEVLARYNEIAATLNSDPSYLEPIFWQAPEGHSIAMDWCEGFEMAMKLRASKWESFGKGKTGSQLLFPIHAHLFDDAGRSLSGALEEEIDQLLDDCSKQIPDFVPKIFTYWKSKQRE